VKLIEAVPNFSLGPNHPAIHHIHHCLSKDPKVCCLHQDAGLDANRTVFTLVGPPLALIERIVEATGVALELIDLSAHTGNHPYVGVLDVCPLIPLLGVTLGEVSWFAQDLGARLAAFFNLPIIFYQNSATQENCRELSGIRRGGIQELSRRFLQGELSPDLGPGVVDPKKGVSVLGAREVMVAYNINLKFGSLEQARGLAARMRALRDQTPGLQSVRFLGWYLEAFQVAQLSMNLMNLKELGPRQIFKVVTEEAEKMGVSLGGSEIVGMCPLATLVGPHSVDPHLEVLKAVEELGLSSLTPFDSDQKIIEYTLANRGFHEESALLLSQTSLERLD